MKNNPNETSKALTGKVIEQLKTGLQTKIIGKDIKYFQELPSTNDQARQLANAGADEGIVVLSDVQTEGRGRRGRFWESPAGGMWLTIILRPKIAPSKAPLLTLLTGSIVAQIIRDKYELEAMLKWPNDVRIDGKKVCGILTELNTEKDAVNFVLIGVGINVNNPSEMFPDELRPVVTTLREEIGHEVDKIELIKEFLMKFENKYIRFCEQETQSYADLIDTWRQLSDTIGRDVSIETITGSVLGQVDNITDDGALIIVTENGERIKILAGDCVYLE
jgi:BirA family biotin operon repressor/biotin-[acetyl-CoA-carboxylase] ligase